MKHLTLIGLTALWQVAAVGLDPVSLAAERADRWTIVAMAALVLAGAAGVGHHHRQSFARMLAFKRRSELLAARLAGEHKQIDRLTGGLAKRLFSVPWLTEPPIGCTALSKLVQTTAAAPRTVDPALPCCQGDPP